MGTLEVEGVVSYSTCGLLSVISVELLMRFLGKNKKLNHCCITVTLLYVNTALIHDGSCS